MLNPFLSEPDQASPEDNVSSRLNQEKIESADQDWVIGAAANVGSSFQRPEPNTVEVEQSLPTRVTRI